MLVNKKFKGEKYTIHFLDDKRVQFLENHDICEGKDFKTLMAMAIMSDDDIYNYTVSDNNVIFHDKIKPTFAAAKLAKIHFEILDDSEKLKYIKTEPNNFYVKDFKKDETFVI